jgi:hypothetical protein
MKAVKAKVLGTGEEIIAVERLDKKGMYFDHKNGVDYKRDEIGIIEDLPEGLMPGIPSSPKHDLPDMERLLVQMLDRQQNTFWRDKRVEIVEILLKRGDCIIENVVEKADSIIQQLKTLGD